MNWLDTWLAKKIKHAWEVEHERKNTIHVLSTRESAVVGSNDIDMDGLRFQVMPATGGTIVQIRHHDRKHDRHNVITHVIPDGEDIAERVGQIVSLELLRA